MAFDTDAHEERLRRDGFTIIDDFLTPSQVEAARTALRPHLGSHLGRNSFEGLETERVYTLVARGEVFEDVENEGYASDYEESDYIDEDEEPGEDEAAAGDGAEEGAEEVLEGESDTEDDEDSDTDGDAADDALQRDAQRQASR